MKFISIYLRVVLAPKATTCMSRCLTWKDVDTMEALTPNAVVKIAMTTDQIEEIKKVTRD